MKGSMFTKESFRRGRGAMGRFICFLCCVFSVVACGRNTISKEDEQLLDAFVFAAYNVEEGQIENYRLWSWRREIVGDKIVFTNLGKHSYGFSDDETNKLTANSKFVRYQYIVSMLKKCLVRSEAHAEFSNGDSQTEFAVYEMGEGIGLFDLSKAYFLKIEFSGPSADFTIKGPGVVCTPSGQCMNEWSKQIFPEDYWSYDKRPPSVLRRDKAVELLRKACPGNPY
jgi:hypothetical protein